MSDTKFFNNFIEKLSYELSNYEIPEEIFALYIYGSILKGNLRTDSDIDVAFLPHYKVSEYEALDLISIVDENSHEN